MFGQPGAVMSQDLFDAQVPGLGSIKPATQPPSSHLPAADQGGAKAPQR